MINKCLNNNHNNSKEAFQILQVDQEQVALVGQSEEPVQ